MKYIIDIDGTICEKTSDYHNAVPIGKRIDKINKLYDEGHIIIYWTARGMSTGKDLSVMTRNQLDLWGCKYHRLDMNKPSYDIWVDDKAINSEVFFV